MTRFLVRPGHRIEGSVRVPGATKNSGTKQMAAALLAPGVTTIANIPPVADLDVMIELLGTLGARVEWTGPDALSIDAGGPLEPEAPYALVSRMRASINVLGPLLARCGEARVAMPGGDNIGSRKINMHLAGFAAMGAEIDVRHGYIEARAPAGLSGSRIVLEFPSVGATENLLTAAVRAKGVTVIENAAREPEMTDLCAFLNRMGAQIMGAGSSTLEIDGVEELTAVDSELMGDRIEAGTLIMACGVAGGEIELTGVRPEHLELVTMKLGEMGMRVSPTPDGLWAQAGSRLRAVDVATLPFPGFATDFMPMVVALLSVADGTAIVTENVYDGRFQFIDELGRMGADVRNEGRHAVVRGVERLSGAPVQASDVRAGAALTIAGLAAEGETVVYACEHVDRGYPDLPGQLRALGADVTRLTD
ncbi:MAG: UDP-N-acetylglucosamine 1-carboxyvinyltransferase [Actinomycetota bacterium]|jgi:UDP-N-acetylglucosamine 1-carboxyvinyltransferase|nr:UDP-N-acetylglucosamine 1-carboxyvinyltransferase [Actinomycetota bacterium]